MHGEIKSAEFQELNEDLEYEAQQEPVVSTEKLKEGLDLSLSVSVGETTMTIDELHSLKKTSIVTLNKLSYEPVDLILSGKVVAKGELVVVDDYFGIKLIEINNTK